MMNNTKPSSIRTQLLLWLLIPILMLLGFGIFSNYCLSRSFVDTAYDDGLEELARMLAGQVELEDDGHFELANSSLTQKMITHGHANRLYYLILGPKKQWIAGQTALGNPPSDHHEGSQYRNAVLNGHSVRVVTLYIPFGNDVKHQWVSVQLAETLDGRQDLLGKILATSILHQLIFILLVIACVWLGVTRGLQPLLLLSQSLQRRSPADLRALNIETAPAEVQPLIQAINDLMMKVQSYLSMQRRFVANAAHQLRTPMAGLQSQVELLIRQELPEAAQHRLTQIQGGLDRSTHLLHQLLSLSRAEPDALKIAQFKPVNLTKLVSIVAESFVPFALKKNIDFGVDVADQEISVLGDESSLYDLLSNLVDNALLYTPDNGKVTIRLFKETHAILCVEDSGYGIPANERERVFERFYRLESNQGIGSGLGLSIVQEIANVHHIQICINDVAEGTGTLVTAQFEQRP